MLLNAHPFPFCPEQLFRRRGPLALEVGFGDGSFLENLALNHPDWNILGADITRPSVERALRRMRRSGLNNVWLYRGSGTFLLRNLCTRRSLFRVYVNYPDPWPKKRHHRRRLLTREFFALLSTRLAVQGMLLLTTDHAAYYTLALEAASDYFTAEQKPPPPEAVQTKYACKWKALERTIYFAELRKTSEAEVTYPRTTGLSTTMHHALLTGTIPPPGVFAPFVHGFQSGRVVVLDALCPVGGHSLIFRARIEEQDLMQDVLIEARCRAQDTATVLVGIMTFGQPLSTRGTREAVRAVVRYLEGHGLLATDYYC